MTVDRCGQSKCIEAISKIGFWFKVAAGPSFHAKPDFPSDLGVKIAGILQYFEDLRPTKRIGSDGPSRNAGK